ncbi:MAG: N-glycosylase/DNA lyase [Candidatus Kapaibacterium sp.]|jgi:N-glycosylase/DNA lyase|nr:N-glycosylase/DNA lyase [Candidatus Kapabacteria bacterium]
MKGNLTVSHINKYKEISAVIKSRLNDFKSVPAKDYFYELCYCICTPQSKAANALIVQNMLAENDFFNKAFDPTPILRSPSNYIRFHNQKAARLLRVREEFNEISEIISSNMSNYEKRNWLANNLNGFGMKESSHFLRNIGYENLAILDRHILRHLMNCGVFDELPKLTPEKNYISVESKFLEFADYVGISLDELDLLFWASSTGEIIK